MSIALGTLTKPKRPPAMKEYDLAWLEEPVWPPEDFKKTARLRHRTGVRPALGENACTVHQFKYLLDAGATDYIMPSVANLNRVTEWCKIAVLFEAYDVPLAPIHSISDRDWRLRPIPSPPRLAAGCWSTSSASPR